MKEYHKIQTVFKRDPETNFKTLLEGDYSEPEFKFLENNEWVFTEKVDGMNIRVMIRDGRVEFRGKTDRASIPATLVSRLREIPEKELLSMFEDGACLYGEGYGSKIQKGGGNYRKDNGFVIFDVMIGGVWLSRENVENIAYELGLEIVPILGSGPLSTMVSIVKEGFISTWSSPGNEFIAEGIVARPAVDILDRRGRRIITKLKHKDFVKK